MGVPGVFLWLFKRFKNLIISSHQNDIYGLFLDANGIYHSASQKIIKENPNITNNRRRNKMIFAEIKNYITFLVEFVSPELLYISTDGVAPLPKLQQQQHRRYRGYHDIIEENEIKERYGKPIITNWTSSVITPGTEWMEELHQELLNYCETLTIPVIYSSYHTPGEGEHKIIKYIKDEGNNRRCVIYGLDADLIFLSLACQKDNIFLLRETSHFGNSDDTSPLKYVSIEALIEGLYQKYNEISENRALEINIRNYINDYVFICMMLGNDFMPHVPSLDIRTRGIDILLETYIKLFNQKGRHMIENEHINSKFLCKLLHELSKKENYYFQTVLPREKRKLEKYQCRSSDPYEIEIWNRNNMKNFIIEDNIFERENIQDIKYEYYLKYFTEFNKDDIVIQYLSCLRWNYEYYFRGCISWSWSYGYNHAPFLSDISKFIHDNNFNMNNIEFEDKIRITPGQQLLMVLPPQLFNLVPRSYAELMVSEDSEIIDLFPTRFGLDGLMAWQYYQCIPELPRLELNRVLETTKDLNLSEEEENRNQELEAFRFIF